MDNLDFLNIVFLENEVKGYLIFVLILLFGYLLISPISSYLRKIIFRIVGNKNHVDGKAEFDNPSSVNSTCWDIWVLRI